MVGQNTVTHNRMYLIKDLNDQFTEYYFNDSSNFEEIEYDFYNKGLFTQSLYIEGH